MNRLEFKQLFFNTLNSLYNERELQAMFRLYLEERLHIPAYVFYMSVNDEVECCDEFIADIQRLAAGVPIQHIIGHTEFYGREFRCDARALVPRRETEELVYHILHEVQFPTAPAVLDLCTGSGIIAITLALELAGADVSATDISQDALTLAAENARLLNANVHFHRADLLQTQHLEGKYDLIVSNPPYIPQSARNKLHKNVTEHDPAEALFVPDETPIIFYEKIAGLAAEALNPNGYLYFETHEDFHDEIAQVLELHGFHHIQCRKDWQGNSRFVSAKNS